MQTLQNGIEVFTNSDDYALADDAAHMGETSNVVIIVADAAARDALTEHQGMVVYRLDASRLEAWNGARWALTATTRLGHSFTTPVAPAGTSYATVASVTVTTLGGTLTLDYTGIFQNDSNDYRSADLQWLIDTSVFAGNTFAVPYIASHQPPYSVALKREVAVAAGTHTIALQTRASAVSAVINTAFSITVYENP